jgi:hypothetical protein
MELREVGCQNGRQVLIPAHNKDDI